MFKHSQFKCGLIVLPVKMHHTCAYTHARLLGSVSQSLVIRSSLETGLGNKCFSVLFGREAMIYLPPTPPPDGY